MYDICCIGHITLDKVVTPEAEVFMAGGTSFYFSNALRKMKINYGLVTAIAAPEMHYVNEMLANGIKVNVLPSAHTVFFENIYSHNRNKRTQRVLQIAAAFSADQLKNTDAGIFHLGPLLAGDIPLQLIQLLAEKGRVSLDVQGYLRKVVDKNVVAIDWKDKIAALPFIHILKANDEEAEVITGEKDIRKAAKILSSWGVKEVVITLGSEGSLLYVGEKFYSVPAYTPLATADATGCGDTYMAGYLLRRFKGFPPGESGRFAAAMASIKIAAHGPFNGTEADVEQFLYLNKKA